MKSDSGETTSIWMATANAINRNPLAEDAGTDVCIIGAGIAGMTTAYMLCREGKAVVVLDDGPAGGGQTERTTAHLSNAFDDRYHKMEQLHGQEGSSRIAASHTAAIDRIEEIVREEIARAEREAREAKRKAAASKANESAAALSASFEDNKKKFAWPAPGFVSQKFGKQPHPALKGIVINNNGINIQTKQDEKVKCIFNGEVRKVALIGVLGNSVIINHGDYFSVYAGLKEVFVKSGDQVTANQEIGVALMAGLLNHIHA